MVVLGDRDIGSGPPLVVQETSKNAKDSLPATSFDMKILQLPKPFFPNAAMQ